ncbi:MAG: hydrogenase formation protein HypD [Deltaproteobacteria bacterium]|nr:hydrogenase formation protein HypD [Deltaproteobacteria bacterium]
MKTPADAARDPSLGRRLLEKVQAYRGPAVAIMEVCGTHTVAIARMGLRDLLPQTVRLLSGPGCPVCVTPVGAFDEAIDLATREGVTLATYGDAMRVPGSRGTLAQARAEGADVRVVYSALDALDLARGEPARRVVLLGLGFETTSPTVAHALTVARDQGLKNFSVLSAHKALLPAMRALLEDAETGIGAFLCPGHASMVLGTQGFRSLSETYGTPCVVAGFEPNDVLLGLASILQQVEAGQARVENAYPRAVTADGNPVALALLTRAFRRVDAVWRGLGRLGGSGYEPADAFAAHDARRLYLGGESRDGEEPRGCRCADVLRGTISPASCPLFGAVCTPETPVGACMVSSEGACGAHYRYRRA